MDHFMCTGDVSVLTSSSRQTGCPHISSRLFSMAMAGIPGPMRMPGTAASHWCSQSPHVHLCTSEPHGPQLQVVNGSVLGIYVSMGHDQAFLRYLHTVVRSFCKDQ